MINMSEIVKMSEARNLMNNCNICVWVNLTKSTWVSMNNRTCPRNCWALSRLVRENFFGPTLYLVSGVKCFVHECTCTSLPTPTTTPLQVTALMVSWPQGNKWVWIEGKESVRVLQLLWGWKPHEQVSYLSKNNKYLIKCSLIFKNFADCKHAQVIFWLDSSIMLQLTNLCLLSIFVG